MALNPFHRSQMKIVEPLRLISCVYQGWSDKYNLEYRASRSAAHAGLLGKQFKIGTPLVVNGKHLVVQSADMTVSMETGDIAIRVEAVDFAAVLARATGTPSQATPQAAPEAAPATPSVAPARFSFGGIKRRILQ